ncbi:transcription antitermination factor NusB [Levilactobacillus bambusae]|uniref:Transcription antitermination protein NusB n=1 Tax=Levilactobacillus bambusae TaxID=2024736 RepID=A0A2V1N1I7_9LACO|nr:transcription antitermination factor NusB [Levilactobacillus bambusae]PWG00932.1 transcription antitermination factor NusB [Levilactobacillus bambusae]
MALTRHQVRERAFQVLFALNANPDGDKDALIQQVLTDDPIQAVPVPPYLQELVDGVLDHEEELDAQIKPYLKSGWTMSRINKTDLILLRLATYEINQVADTPNRVAVNESLQLAKEYSDEKSRRFINGVLSHALENE